MSSRNRFPRLTLCCLGLIASASLTHICAQSPQNQLTRPAKCTPTTPSVPNIWDFENGLEGWSKPEPASAFELQPIDGSTITTDLPSKLVKLGGDYWRGVPYFVGQHGRCLILTEDGLEGSLTTPDLTLRAEAPYLNLLIGGSKDLAHERFELQILFTSEEDATKQKKCARAHFFCYVASTVMWRSVTNSRLHLVLVRRGNHITAGALQCMMVFAIRRGSRLDLHLESSTNHAEVR